MSPSYEKIIAYIVETMTPERVLDIETPIEGETTAQEFVNTLKQYAKVMLDDDDEEMPLEAIQDLVNEAIVALENGQTYPISTLWDDIDAE
jgi:hypothetical protein